jgi:hypothetical protein
MGPLLQERNTWKTELFSLEEMCDEEGNCTYYLDNVGIICGAFSSRKHNIVLLKDHLYKIIKKLENMSEEEILTNIEKNVIEHMQ